MSLYQELIKCLVPYHFEEPGSPSGFLPLSDITTNITEDNIKFQLSILNRLWYTELPRKVILQARKIFTILVLIDRTAAIVNLIHEDNISDADLPLTRKGSIGEHDYNVLVSTKTGRAFSSFATWASEVKVREFFHWQWVVQAPVMERLGEHISLNPMCPLPLTESLTKAQGGSGLVHKCKVHPAHQTIFKHDTELYIAIKEINVEQPFDREMQNLELIQDLEHKHIIKLIATCQKGPMFYVMFPWADGGDLRDFWKHNDPRPRTPALILWSLRQMLGIVSAIRALHGRNIRHGDIKPQNILHFLEGEGENTDEGGILVIADVGISRFHQGIASMRNASINSNVGTILYEAPEAESDQREGKPRPRRSDMWSLGCMFLEFTIWLVDNYNALRSFRRRQTSRRDPTIAWAGFFTRDSQNSAHIHSAVTETIKHLRDNPLCKDNSAMGDFIQLIGEHLLQIEVLRRAEAPEVFDKLRRIVRDAEEIPGYVDGQIDAYLSDIESDIESIFTETESLPGTDSSVGIPVLRNDGIREVANTLLADPTLRLLYVDAISRVERSKCRVHFKGFLKAYATGLKAETGDFLETQVASFIGLRAGQVSDEIRRAIVSPKDLVQLGEGSSRLEHQLAAIKGQDNTLRDRNSGTETHEGEAETVPLEHRTGPVVESQSKSELETEDYADNSDPGEVEPLALIDNLKGFILEADAFKVLIDEMKSWLKKVEKDPGTEVNPSVSATADTLDSDAVNTQRMSPQSPIERNLEQALEVEGVGKVEETREVEEIVAAEDVRVHSGPGLWKNSRDTLKSCIGSSGILDVLHSITNMFEPPVKQGYRRLKWRCSCGTLLWSDFDNSDPEALDDLFKELHHVPNVAETDGQSRKAFVREADYANHTKTVSYQQGGDSCVSGKSGQGSLHSDSSLGTTALQQNSSNSSSHDSEQQIVGDGIGGLTLNTPRTAHPLSFGRSHFFEVCISTGNHAVRLKEINLSKVWSDGELFLQIWDRYSQTRGYGIRSIFLKPRDVHFVKFSVDRASKDLAGIHEWPSEYPPQDEVDKQRYHYRCPRILMPSHLFLHFLHRAGKGSGNDHMHDTWLQRLPKKLDTGILDLIQWSVGIQYPGVGLVSGDERGDPIYGWGAHIIEGPNQAGLSIVLACGIAVSFFVSCVLTGFSKTEEQAFGVGQFLIAIVSCGMAAIYFALTDR